MITEIKEGDVFGVCVCTSIGRGLTVGRHYLTTIDDAHIIISNDDNTWQYPYGDEIKMVGRLKITKVK